LVNEKQNWLAPLLIAGVLLMATLGYGHYRLQSSKISPDKIFKVGVVQGNIPQDEKWQRGSAGKILRIFQEGTAELEAKGAELILWPEASFPLLLNYDQKQISYKLGTSHADLLFGAITHPSRFQGISSDEPYYNSGVLVDAKGEIADYYHKRHLVPFGEYVPWKDIFFFARKLTVEVGNLLPGEDFRPLDYREIKLGLLICYEDIFPEIARIMVGKGAGVLINISNDAWYGYSSAAFQHQVFSQFRSIETRRALVRATNTGLSSLIDRWGRVIWQGEMFQRQNFLTDLPTYSDRSLYVRIGDVFPVVCLLFIGVAVLVAMKKK
jgi:apolipoprotein N-acyltransferase